MTRLGTVCPAIQLRLEAFGRVLPEGQTVRKLGAVVVVTVMLRIAEEAPFAGTPPAPVTWTAMLRGAPGVRPATVRLRDWPAPTAPPELLVSSKRTGLTAV